MDEISLRRLIYQAWSFEVAAQVLFERIVEHGMQQLTAPYTVNATFSLELFLKATYFITTNRNPPKDHNLLVLFRSLPKDAQQKIPKILARAPGVTEETFFQILEISQDGFVVSRYLHEQPGDEFTGVTLLAINKAVQVYLLDVAPDLIMSVKPGEKTVEWRDWPQE